MDQGLVLADENKCKWVINLLAEMIRSDGCDSEWGREHEVVHDCIQTIVRVLHGQ